MIREVLHGMGGIGVYGLASMLLFVTFFAGVMVWVIFLRRPYIDHMSRLPLEHDDMDSSGDEPHE